MIIRAGYAEARGVRWEVIKHPGAKRGFVLSRWSMVERSALAVDSGVWPRTTSALGTAVGLHLVAFAYLFLHRTHNIL